MAETDTITIKRDYYNTLKRNNDMLQALFECGVDNWEGYSEACKLLDNSEEDDDVR